jgi:hypothetical protein
MADIFDNFSNLTLNNQEATQDSDLIKVNPYFTPELNRIHGVQTGVIMDKYIPILGQFDDIGLVDPGSCGTNTYTDGIAVSQKTWTPKLISARIKLCADDIPAKLKFWMETQKASGRWENINNPLKQFVLDRTQEAVTRAIIRVADFGDTGGLLVADGGYLTAGTTIALFTMLDGLWKQIFTDGALGTPLIYRYEIDENTKGTADEQLTLADNAAYLAFKALDENLPPEAEAGNNVLQCTKSLWDNWVTYIENKSGAYRPEILQDGMTKETFRGRPLIVRKDWDRLIRKYHNLGTTYYLPHRAILTDINNIPVGTSDTQSFTTLNAFYVPKDKAHYTDVAWREDCKLLQEDSIAVAY